jgi:glucokinase
LAVEKKLFSMSEHFATKKVAGIEATKTLLRACVTENGAITHRFETALDYNEPTLPRVANAIVELRGSFGVEIVGLAISGLINRSLNRVVQSTQMPELTETDAAAELAAAGGTRVYLENDANAAAYGEYALGAGRGAQSLFYATIGAGVGGSLIFDDKIWRGANGFAGEFGNITINEDGVRLEDVASESNILRRTRERLLQDSTSSLSRRLIEQTSSVAAIVEAAENGDDFAMLMLERTGAYIGTAIASVINLLNVEKVIIGGAVLDAGGVILSSIVRQARRRSFLPSFDLTEIVAAALGADAPAIGAALLAAQAENF